LQISEACFETAELETMRESLDNEGMISVRFPVVVKSRSGPNVDCHFDVHLTVPFDLEHTEQAVIRRDLLIGEEPVGGGKLRQRARGLTLINNRDLSKLLLSAEEATHLRWNTKLPRLAEYYRSGPEIVAIVRNAAARLLDVLTEGDRKRDFRLLAKYFAAPGTASALPAKGKRSAKSPQPPPPDVIPAPRPKLLAIEALADGCRVRPAKAGVLADAKLPLNGRLEFAYEGLDRDAFSDYDPLDFDIGDGTFVADGAGYTLKRKSLNVLEFAVDSPEFELSVSGFDSNLRLRMRLLYEEATDAETVDAQ